MTARRLRRIILVTGAGRTGSSTVAGLLHNHFNINMGEQWIRPPDNFNPKGYYEDLAFGNIIQNLLTDRVHNEDTMNQVLDMLKEVIAERDAKYTDWGFKANTLYTCLPFVIAALPKRPIIIRTRRPMHQTLLSWLKTFKTPFRQCMAELLLREHMMDLLESQGYPMHHIWFDSTHRKSDDELIEEIRGILLTPYLFKPNS